MSSIALNFTSYYTKALSKKTKTTHFIFTFKPPLTRYIWYFSHYVKIIFLSSLHILRSLEVFPMKETFFLQNYHYYIYIYLQYIISIYKKDFPMNIFLTIDFIHYTIIYLPLSWIIVATLLLRKLYFTKNTT